YRAIGRRREVPPIRAFPATHTNSAHGKAARTTPARPQGPVRVSAPPITSGSSLIRAAGNAVQRRKPALLLRRGVGAVILRRAHQRLGDDAGIGADLLLDRLRHGGVLAQEILGVLAALADALAIVGKPGTRLLDDVGLHAEVDEFAHLGHALAVHDVELDDTER